MKIEKLKILWLAGLLIVVSVGLVVAEQKADFNGDGQVNFTDFYLFCEQFGLAQGEPGFDARFDLDKSGEVDFSDFTALKRSFNTQVAAAKVAMQAQSQSLVSNLTARIHGESDFSRNDFAQEFTTGSSGGGYTLTSVDLNMHFESSNRAAFSVAVHASSNGQPGSSLATLTAPQTLRIGTNMFTHAGLDLDPSTSYFVVIDVSTTGWGTTIRATDSDDESGAAGWTIGNVSRNRVHNATGTWGSHARALSVRISGSVKPVPVTVPDSDLVSNFDEGSVSGLGYGFNDVAQGFTTGSSSTGYTLTSVELDLFHEPGESRATFTVAVHASSSGAPGASLATLTSPQPISNGINKFTHTGLDLDPSTSYFVVIDVTAGASANSLNLMTSTNETGAAGWTVADTGVTRAWNSAGAWGGASDHPWKIRIRGSVKPAPLPHPDKQPCAAAPIEFGTYEDKLTDECGAQFQPYHFPAYARHASFSITGEDRQTVVFTLESDDFDPQLYLAEGPGPGSSLRIGGNDDQAQPYSLNSRLVKDLDPGDYILEITSAETLKTGSFVLRFGNYTSHPVPRAKVRLADPPKVGQPGGGKPPPPYTIWVRVSPVSGSESALDLSWEAVNGAESYIVQWKTGDQEYSEAERIHTTATRTTSHRIGGLSPGSSYTVKVTVRLSGGRLGRSGEGMGMTGGPLAVTVSPVSGSATALDVSWGEVEDAFGYVFGYVIEWKADGQEYSESERRHRTDYYATITTHSIEGLAPATAYTVRVTALLGDDDRVGEGRGTTNPAPVSPPEEPEDPEDPEDPESPAAVFVIYYDPNAGDAAVDRYNQAVALLKEAGISYSVVTGDVQDDVDRLAGVTDSVIPRFFLGDPTEEGWVSETKVNNGGLRWLKQKVAELRED